MEILRALGGLLIYSLMFLYFAMPIWVILLVTSIKYGKKSELEISSPEEKVSLIKYLFSKNKFILINSFIALILLGFGYLWLMRGGCEGGATGCMGYAIMVIPVLLSFLVIGIVLLVSVISSVSKYYYPNQIKFNVPKKVKILLISVIILYLAYNIFGQAIFRIIKS